MRQANMSITVYDSVLNDSVQVLVGLSLIIGKWLFPFTKDIANDLDQEVDQSGFSVIQDVAISRLSGIYDSDIWMHLLMLFYDGW